MQRSRNKGSGNEEKNKLIETNPGLTQKLQYAEKDFKTVIMTKWHIFEKQTTEDIKDIKLKSNIQRRKLHRVEINWRLDISEEKITDS